MTDNKKIIQERDELAQYVINNTAPICEPQREDEISIRDFAAIQNCSVDMARSKLEEMVKKGLMTRRFAKGNHNSPMMVYRKKEAK